MSTIRLARAPDLAAVEALVDAAYSHYVAGIDKQMHENLTIYRRYGYIETHRAEERG